MAGLRASFKTIGSIILLVGCADPTSYHPFDGQGGYAEQKIEDDRYRVEFVGNGVTPRDQVEMFLLYRAAELTLLNAHERFWIVDRATGSNTAFIGFDNGVIATDRFRNKGTNQTLVMNTTHLTQVTRFDAFAEILFVDLPFENDDGRVYDAQQVIQNLQSIVGEPSKTTFDGKNTR